MAFNNNKGELDFPYDIVDVDPEINSELLQDFTGDILYSPSYNSTINLMF